MPAFLIFASTLHSRSDSFALESLLGKQLWFLGNAFTVDGICYPKFWDHSIFGTSLLQPQPLEKQTEN